MGLCVLACVRVVVVVVVVVLVAEGVANMQFQYECVIGPFGSGERKPDHPKACVCALRSCVASVRSSVDASLHLCVMAAVCSAMSE